MVLGEAGGLRSWGSHVRHHFAVHRGYVIARELLPTPGIIDGIAFVAGNGPRC